MIYIDLKNEPKARKHFGAYIVSCNKLVLVERLLVTFKPKYVEQLMKKAKEGDPDAHRNPRDS